MADYERTVLDFYQLPTPYPTSWPAEKDDDDASSADEADRVKKMAQQRKSRYQALERVVSDRRSIVSTASGSRGGVGNIVQKDEPDPLGSSDSVIRSLKQLGLPVQDDVKLRNRFLLSSTNFSPALFLSQMHSDADTETLRHGLNVLSHSIEQKSASLKVLVETNFERFVKAKATIDNVYKEMKYRGVEQPAPARTRAHSRSHSRTHSRQHSKTSFRNSISGIGAVAGFNNPLTPAHADARKKNALVKESEYGVMGIKGPLLDVSAKAEDVWGPALGGREKEETLRTVSEQLSKFKEYAELSTAISDSIKRKDYESLVDEYNRARKFADDAKKLALEFGDAPMGDSQIYQILLAGRMWHDIEQQIQPFKKDIWRKLISVNGITRSGGFAGGRAHDHMELIGLLLELGTEDSPVWVWLLSRYDNLKSKIQAMADRAKVEIEVLRRRLAGQDKPTPQATAAHLRLLEQSQADGKPSADDSTEVIELWEKMVGFLTNLLSSKGIVGEMLEFWSTAQGFINGDSQRTLPLGYNNESRKHHHLSDQVKTDLERGVVDLVELIREHVYSFFAGPPPEDISLLFSPLPPSPGYSGPPTPVSATLGPGSLRDPRFNLDPNNAPPPSPKRGEPWEKLGFWPPWSNSISGVHYLSTMLALVGSGASDMASIRPVATGDPQTLEGLKTLVGVSRERCVTALCSSWNKDAENIKLVEDWRRVAEHGDVTRMPATFALFEGALLSGMQKLLYLSEAVSKPGAGDIVLPPPTKLLQAVRSQYVTTLYKALSGMVENAERSLKKTDDEWSSIVAISDESSDIASGPDPGDRVSAACCLVWSSREPHANIIRTSECC